MFLGLVGQKGYGDVLTTNKLAKNFKERYCQPLSSSKVILGYTVNSRPAWAP